MADNDFGEDEQEVIRLAREAGEKIARYEAGQDATPVTEGAMVTTPGQLWHRLLNAPEDQRLAMLQAALENAQTAHDCFMQDHRGLGNQLEEERELLSICVFDMPTGDSTRQLHTAVRALRQIMVDGIAARTTTIEYAEVEPEGFPAEPSVQEKITETLKAKGIDLQSICDFEWGTASPCPDSADGRHVCGEVNPLHVQSHNCGGTCRAELSHIEAEQIAEANQ